MRENSSPKGAAGWSILWFFVHLSAVYVVVNFGTPWMAGWTCGYGLSWGWGSVRSRVVAGRVWARSTTTWSGRQRPVSVGRCPKVGTKRRIKFFLGGVQKLLNSIPLCSYPVKTDANVLNCQNLRILTSSRPEAPLPRASWSGHLFPMARLSRPPRWLNACS